MALTIQIVILLVFIACSAMFSASETALFSLSRARLMIYADDPSPSKRLVAELMKSYHFTLTALILSNTFVNTCISMIYNEIMSGLKLDEVTTAVVSIFVTVVILLVFGEITPKTVALYFAEPVSQMAARPVWLLRRMLAPAIFVVDKTFGAVVELLGGKSAQALESKEYSSYIESAGNVGIFSAEETKLLGSAFALIEKTVAEVMTNRTEIKAVSRNADPEEVARVLRASRHECLPVYTDDIDDAEHILSAREFFMLSKEEREKWSRRPCVSPVTFIPENTNLTRALATMRRNSVSTALAVDEYGGVSGIIDIGDIYGELIGEMDYADPLVQWKVKQSDWGVWSIDGGAPLYILKDITGWVPPGSVEANTVNGLFCEKLERLPLAGDKIELSGFRMTATAVARHRVTRARVEFDSAPRAEGGAS
jgi:CBS domain containing-hemolysin-like protein